MVLLYVILGCLFVGVGSLDCVAAESQVTLGSQIQTAAQMKSEAEAWAEALKQSYGNKKISEKNYRKSQSLYIDARGGVDGWVTALQAEIEQGLDPAKSSRYAESLRVAADKAYKFVEWAKQVLVDEPAYKTRAKAVLVIADVAKVFTDFGIQFWKEWSVVKQRDREVLIKRLEGLKWKAFE